MDMHVEVLRSINCFVISNRTSVSFGREDTTLSTNKIKRLAIPTEDFLLGSFEGIMWTKNKEKFMDDSDFFYENTDVTRYNHINCKHLNSIATYRASCSFYQNFIKLVKAQIDELEWDPSISLLKISARLWRNNFNTHRFPILYELNRIIIMNLFHIFLRILEFFRRMAFPHTSQRVVHYRFGI
uniref:Glycosyltransferase family 92 protein n=1 Tax=Heterorhabditis bacteriophora TaxID=37862 RepID=A0A1I7WXM0_HETBA